MRRMMGACVVASSLATVAAAGWARPRATEVLPQRAPAMPVVPGSSDGWAEEQRPDEVRHVMGLVVPARQVTVRAPIDGVVAAVATQPGEQVGAGAVLVTLDDGAVTLEAERQAARLAANLHHTAAAAAELELLGQKARQLRSVRDQRAASLSELALVECQARVAAARVKALGEERRELEVGLREIRRRADAHRVVSPIPGEVAEAVRVPGEYVRAGEPLVTVRSNGRYVRLHLPAPLALHLPRLRFTLAGGGELAPVEQAAAQGAWAAGATPVALALPDRVDLPVGQAVTVDVEAP